MFRRRFRQGLFLLTLFVAGGAAYWNYPVSAAGDAIVDAKRKAAAQLLRDGKTVESISLIREVLSAEDSGYADHLLLAHAHEKLGQNTEALQQYKRVMELLPAAPSKSDEKQARLEADKKVKLMDPLAGKLDAFTDDVLRKLDGLEKEAITLRSMSALERIFRLRGNLWNADHHEDRSYVQVQASLSWQQSGLTVVAGNTYRIRAAGIWVINGMSCTAAGVLSKPDRPPYGRVGQLVGLVKDRLYNFSDNATFTPDVSGTLAVQGGEDPNQVGKTKGTGILEVLISRE